VAHPALFYSAWWPQMAVLEWVSRLFQVTTSKQPDTRTHHLDYPEDDLTADESSAPAGRRGSRRTYIRTV
jgi:hypothetical protein